MINSVKMARSIDSLYMPFRILEIDKSLDHFVKVMLWKLVDANIPFKVEFIKHIFPVLLEFDLKI